MGVDEGGLQIIDDIAVIILLYGKYSPVALVIVFVIHTILHINDSMMSKR